MQKDLRFKPGVPGNQFKFHDDDDVVWKEVMKKKKLAAERGKQGPGQRLLKMKWDRDKDDIFNSKKRFGSVGAISLYSSSNLFNSPQIKRLF